ncbi:hypothetical protein Tco_0536082 [Tanacetum coccineum]
MHTRASNSELVELLSEPERTLNRRLHRRNRRFLDILENYNPMDDEPMWATDRVVAPTPGSAITITETANEFAIKDAMTMKMDAQYKEMQSRSNDSIPEYDEDDKPMSPEVEAKFMQTF